MTSPPHIKSKAIWFELLILFVCLLFYVCVFFADIIHDAVRHNKRTGTHPEWWCLMSIWNKFKQPKQSRENSSFSCDHHLPGSQAQLQEKGTVWQISITRKVWFFSDLVNSLKILAMQVSWYAPQNREDSILSASKNKDIIDTISNCLLKDQEGLSSNSYLFWNTEMIQSNFH